MDITGNRKPVVVVAGATGGIGSVTSKLLSASGATVIAAGRNEDRIQSLHRELQALNPRSAIVRADLDCQEGWSHLLNFVLTNYGRIDTLVNCIGILIPGPFAQLDSEDIARVIRTNVLGVAYGVATVIPTMQKQGSGHIIVIGSLGGILPMPNAALYSATKFAVRGLMFSLREELRTSGIHVSLVSPGPVRTSMLDDESRDDSSTMAFVQRPIAPQIVAKAVLSLINRPRAELLIPGTSGRTSRVFAALPQLFSVAHPLLDRIGRARLASYRRQGQSASIIR